MARQRSDSSNKSESIDGPSAKRRKVSNGDFINADRLQESRYDQTAAPLTSTVRSSHPPITWITAKSASERHYLTQAKGCNSNTLKVQSKGQAHWFLNGPVQKCKTCTEKARGITCRFEGVRAFAAVTNGEEIDLFDVENRKTGDYVVTGKVLVKEAIVEVMGGWPSIKGFKVGEWPDVKDWVLVGDTDPEKMAVFDPNSDQSPHGISPGVRTIEETLSKAHDNASLTKLDEEAQSVLRLTASTLQSRLQHIAEYIANTDSKSGWSQAQGSLSTPIISRNREPDERVVCDACSTTCFICSWMCMVCGIEICVDCWEEWQSASTDIVADGTEPFETMFVPRLDQCVYRRRHTRAQFYLISRANISEVKWLLERTGSEIWKRDTPPVLNGHLQDDPGDEVDNVNQPFRYPYTFHSISARGSATHQDQEALFQQVWHASGNQGLGIPIVIHGISSPLQTSKWTPEYFKQHYGTEECQVVDCDSNETNPTTIAKFFEAFTQAEKSVKLKDWPPHTDFATHCPELFKDFEQNLLPFPKYMSRTGFKNLASMFPERGVCIPDLGPKCYIAGAAPGFLTSSDPTDGDDIKGLEKREWTTDKGTTNLHLDVTDAINIMVHAAPGSSKNSQSQPSPPAAIWHIFSPSSTATINAYLRQKHKANPIDDPINRQLFYLNAQDLTTLNTEKWGFTRAYRIHQEPGDAVLIPAGCAHQVANGRSSIKVAVDFITAERIHLCAGIMGMFRDLAGQYVYRDVGRESDQAKGKKGKINKGGVGVGAWRMGPKEDVLQLYDCLYFAWFQIAALANKFGLEGTCALLGIRS